MDRHCANYVLGPSELLFTSEDELAEVHSFLTIIKLLSSVYLMYIWYLYALSVLKMGYISMFRQPKLARSCC